MDRPRPSRLDGLGLRHAPGWRILPLIVAAMTFLAALAIAGAQGAAELGRHWQQGAAATLTVQVPRPGTAPSPPVASGETRRDRVTALLRGTPSFTLDPDDPPARVPSIFVRRHARLPLVVQP